MSALTAEGRSQPADQPPIGRTQPRQLDEPPRGYERVATGSTVGLDDLDDPDFSTAVVTSNIEVSALPGS